MRISDWSSDVCSSDLHALPDLDRQCRNNCQTQPPQEWHPRERQTKGERQRGETQQMMQLVLLIEQLRYRFRLQAVEQDERQHDQKGQHRSEEHTSQLQSLMRTPYAVSCLKKKKT